MDYIPPGSPAGEVRGRGPRKLAQRQGWRVPPLSRPDGLVEGVRISLAFTREGLRHRYRGARIHRAIPYDGRISLRRAVRRSGAPA
jgi:hypothetical protein